MSASEEVFGTCDICQAAIVKGRLEKIIVQIKRPPELLGSFALNTCPVCRAEFDKISQMATAKVRDLLKLSRSSEVEA